MDFEKKGVPTVTVCCTQGFDVLARTEAKGMGVPGLPLVTVDYRLTRYAQNDEETQGQADKVAAEIMYAITTPPEKLSREQKNKQRLEDQEKAIPMKPKMSWDLQPVEAPASLRVANALFYERGWTDGLPIVPPTAEEVQQMLRYTDRDPQDVVAKVAPRWGKATVEKIAINAVMAGCLPEYFPAVIAAVQAVSEPEFNLFALQQTTNPVAPLTIFNGPIAKEIKLNSGYNVLGQGWQANATIGRAVRLVLTNIGGGIPGVTDKASHGMPGKFSFCIAENEEDSPWAPLHVERGFENGVSTVTVAGVQGTHNIHCWVGTPASILPSIANGMAAFGTNNMDYAGVAVLLMHPLQARIVFEAGFTKEGVKQFMFNHARLSTAIYPPECIPTYKLKRSHISYEIPGAFVPVVERWEDIMIVVAGGGVAGHATFLPTFGRSTEPITKPIALKDGTPVKSVKDFKKTKRAS
ncbi:MAG: UGSC family (seleno)protein [Chloroflexota bacterium]